MSEEILAEWTATDAEGDGGLPYVPPLAQFGAERETVPGLLAGIELVEGLGAAEIRDGMARIPATAGTGGGETTSALLAQFDNPYQSDTPGLLAGIEVRKEVAAPFVEDGVAVLMFYGSAARAPMNALLNGSGDYKINFVTAILDGIVMRIGLSVLFGIALGMGYIGFWLGDALAGFTPLFIGAVFYITGKWKKQNIV